MEDKQMNKYCYHCEAFNEDGTLYYEINLIAGSKAECQRWFIFVLKDRTGYNHFSEGGKKFRIKELV